MKKIIVGLTGASGSILFKKFVEELSNHDVLIYIIATNYGKQVFAYEIQIEIETFINNLNNKNIILCEQNDMFSQVASGSFSVDGMIIIPCSVGTIGKIAHGTSDNLLIRCADVQIKEKRKLLIVPREAPLSSIHLENILKLSNNNVMILPAMMSFYNKPTSLDDMLNEFVGRALSYFDINSSFKKTWRKN